LKVVACTGNNKQGTQSWEALPRQRVEEMEVETPPRQWVDPRRRVEGVEAGAQPRRREDRRPEVEDLQQVQSSLQHFGELVRLQELVEALSAQLVQ